MDLAYDSLTVDQKKQLAIEWRPSMTIRAIAEKLGLGEKAVFNCTRGIVTAATRGLTEEQRLALEPKNPITVLPTCECGETFRDRSMDRYCMRGVTCVKCGKGLA